MTVVLWQLMHQLDVLISERQKEWEGKMKESQAELKLREKELTTLRISLQERTDQVRTKITINGDHDKSFKHYHFFVVFKSLHSLKE